MDVKRIDLPIPYYACLNDYQMDKFIKLVRAYEPNIRSVYAPIGRVSEKDSIFGLRNRSESVAPITLLEESQFDGRFIEIISELGLPVKILINDLHASVATRNLDNIHSKLRWMSSFATIDSVVVADFAAMHMLGDMGFRYTVSVNGAHNDIELGQFIGMDNLGLIKEVVIWRDYNRSPGQIKRISGIIDSCHDKPISKTIMANEGCVTGCTYRTSGDIQISRDNEGRDDALVNIHAYGCKVMNENWPWLFMTSPFLTKEMADSVPYSEMGLKIAGRNLDVSGLATILSYYVNGDVIPLNKLLNTNQLKGLLTSDLTSEYQDRVMKCDKICWRCKDCEGFYNKAVMSKLQESKT